MYIVFETGEKTNSIKGKSVTFDPSLGYFAHMWYALASCKGETVNHIFNSKKDLELYVKSCGARMKDAESKEFMKFALAAKWLFTLPAEKMVDERVEAYESGQGIQIMTEIPLPGWEICSAGGEAEKGLFLDAAVTVDLDIYKEPQRKGYAVHMVGGVVINHVFSTWTRCKMYTEGKHAFYKSFPSLEGALSFLKNIDSEWIKRCEYAQKSAGADTGFDIPRDDTIHIAEDPTSPAGLDIPFLRLVESPRTDALKDLCLLQATAYVDGSARNGNGVCIIGSGVYIEADEDPCVDESLSFGFIRRPAPVAAELSLANSSDSLFEPSLVYRHTGEMQAAMIAAEWCIRRKLGSVTIVYGYEGVRSFALGLWDAGNEETKAYRFFMKGSMEHIDIVFKKAKGLGKEKAASLAKKAERIFDLKEHWS